MPDTVTHPSPEKLAAYGLGQLPPDQATLIEQHISECEPCCETIFDLSSGDTFIDLLYKAKHAPKEQTVDHDGQVTRPTSVGVPAQLAEHPRYEIVGLIGKGGMGDVYKARHRMMDRTVALKIINRELVCKPDAVDRFHREVKTAARLSHSNIVTAYDAEQAGDVHFLVMEYVDGVDLAHTVRDQGALSITDACDYVRQAAFGLQYAHEMGMVHRDIKPHNLMVTAGGTVKILDFGLAALASGVLSDADTVEGRSDLTAVGSIMGTPDFISPEQADDAHRADIRSDIYSLGVTLYYLLSGRPPFVDGSVMHKLKSHAQTEPEPIQNIITGVPDEVAEVVRRMMAKDPAERFQSPADVAAALAPFAGQDSQARADSDAKLRQPKAQPRWKRLMGISAALLLILLSLACSFGGTVIRFATNKGVLVVEVDDKNVEIVIKDQNGFTLHDKSTDREFVIKAVEGEVEVYEADSNLLLLTKKFTLTRGGKEYVRVSPLELAEERARAKTPPNGLKVIGGALRQEATEMSVVRRTATPVRTIDHGEGTSTFACYLPDGTIVSTSQDRSAHDCFLYFTPPGSDRATDGTYIGAPGASQVDVSADGRWIAIANRNGHQVQLWDA